MKLGEELRELNKRFRVQQHQRDLEVFQQLQMELRDIAGVGKTTFGVRQLSQGVIDLLLGEGLHVTQEKGDWVISW